MDTEFSSEKDLDKSYFHAMVGGKAYLDSIQEKWDKSTWTMNIDDSFDEFCSERKEKNRIITGGKVKRGFMHLYGGEGRVELACLFFDGKDREEEEI